MRRGERIRGPIGIAKLSRDERIDIIANDDGAAVFIEVLAKADLKTGFPQELMADQVRESRESEAIAWFIEAR